MSFNFGGTGSSFQQNSNSNQPASSGLFGNTSAPGTTSAFGQAPTATSGPSGGLFGGSSAAPASGGLFSGGAAPGTTPSLFGGGLGNGSKPNSGASTPSIFGGAGSGAAPGGMFGSKPAATTGAASPGLFGTSSATPASSFGGGFSFGQKKDEGAGAGAAQNKGLGTPTGSLFGGAAKPAGAPLFGGLANNAASSAPSGLSTPAANKFTLGASTTPAGPPPADSAKPLFGALGGQQNTLFGASKPSDQSSTPASRPPMFSSGSNTPGGGGIFSGGSSTGGPGLFSGLNQSTPASSGTSAAAPPAFSFNPGTPVSSTATTQPASTAQAQPSLFNLNKPAGSTTPAAATPSLFGPPKTTPASTAPTSTPSLFGAANPSTSTPASTPGLFGTANTSTAPKLPSLFGALGGTSAPTSTPGTSAPSTAAPAAPTNLFGTPVSKPTAASTTAPNPTSTTAPAPAATASNPLSNILGTGTASGSNVAPKTDGHNGTNPALGSSTAGPSPQLTRLKNKTMDEIITRWASDLSKYQKDFQEQALKVAAWDRLMVENGEKINKLSQSTGEAKGQAAEIEKQLANVESQQNELDNWLRRYEEKVDEMFAKQVGQGDSLAGPDSERERTYKLAEKLTDRLDDMGKNLTSMIEAINDASTTLSKTSKADDPLSHIVRVLNSHLTQLQWIDENALALQTKVAEAQKTGQSYGQNGSGGPESDAAESFYRSFQSRR